MSKLKLSGYKEATVPFGLPDRATCEAGKYLGSRIKIVALFIICLVLGSMPVHAADVVLIHAGKLLAVPGQAPQANKTIVVSKGRIVEIRDGFVTVDGLQLSDGQTAATVDLSESFVLPGLMDAHVHLMWSGRDHPPKKQGGGSTGQQSQLNKEGLTLWTLRHARTTLASGFTTVREMASEPNVMFAVRDWINGGKFIGPRILAAGQPVTAAGGHGDNAGADSAPDGLDSSGLCDGLESCRRAVRIQHKRGSDVIKMMSTGGFSDHTGTEQFFFYDEMEATVHAAHQLGLAVATHAYAGDAIADAVRAGVDSVEHGFGATDATLKEMQKKNIYLVPTLSVAQRKGAGTTLYREKHHAFERALDIGTPIAFGSDVGGIPHRYAAREFLYMVNLGMSPAAAIVSATINTAKLFRLENEVGTIEPGKLADIIAVNGNPLEDIESLQEISFVMKSGRVAKQNGVMKNIFLD
ncbi:MAG: amidohydrolase family protein [Gammaproteobacteria bacterium]|nr:amidohydrolase family protein [Gammaproteobacteria bacterium]